MTGLFAGLANSKSDSFAARVIFDVYASWLGKKKPGMPLAMEPTRSVAAFLLSAWHPFFVQQYSNATSPRRSGSLKVLSRGGISLDMSQAQQIHIVSVLLEVILPPQGSQPIARCDAGIRHR